MSPDERGPASTPTTYASVSPDEPPARPPPLPPLPSMPSALPVDPVISLPSPASMPPGAISLSMAPPEASVLRAVENLAVPVVAIVVLAWWAVRGTMDAWAAGVLVIYVVQATRNGRVLNLDHVQNAAQRLMGRRK